MTIIERLFLENVFDVSLGVSDGLLGSEEAFDAYGVKDTLPFQPLNGHATPIVFHTHRAASPPTNLFQRPLLHYAPRSFLYVQPIATVWRSSDGLPRK